jgi:hypothetical protein
MSRRCVIAVLAILSLSLFVGSAWAGSNVWTASGPAGGPIRAILVVDPASPSTVFVGTLGSGVFKSENGGDTWLQSGLDGLTIRALVRDPTSGTFYAGVDNDPAAASGGVFSSPDGANWTPIDPGLTNKKVQALALDGSTLYAGTGGGGVFKLNGGTWSAVNAAGFTSPNCPACPFQILSLATDSRNPGTVYAGSEGSGVYKTTDAGANWTRYPLPPPVSPYAQGWRSDCLEDAEVQALLVDLTQATETVYAGAKGKVGNSGCGQNIGGTGASGQGPGFFRFLGTDPLWDRKMNGMYGADIPATFTLGVYAIAMLGNRVYVGTDFGVFSSTDQGSSWDGVPRAHNPAQPSNLVGLPIRALSGSLNGDVATGTTTLFAGSVGRGMFKREHVGTALGDGPWTEKNTGLTALRAKSVAVVPVVAQPGQSRILAGLSSGSIIKSDDGGTTWQNTTETPPPTHYAVTARTVNGIAVDPSDLTTVWAATGRGVIKSTDRGDTWASASSGLPTKLDPPVFCPKNVCSSQVNLANFTVPLNVPAIAADPANPGVLYAAVAGVYTSVNGGATWVALNGNLPTTVTSGAGAVSAIVVDPTVGDPIFGTIYAATSGFGVYKSINAGVTWTLTTGIPVADQNITALALEPLPDPGTHTLYAGTSTGLVYRSDNGSNWGLGITLRGLPGNPITALAIRIADPRVIYAATSGAGVYNSTNGGASWTVFDSNTGLALDVAAVAVDGTQAVPTLYAATLGRGMHDLEIVPLTGVAPDILIQTPPSPYPVEATASQITVTATGLNTAIMLWSTNRGHAGSAVNTGGTSWSASSIPLEPGLNLITLTAVSPTDSNEASVSLTVNLAELDPVISVTPPSLSFGTVAVGNMSSMQNVTVQNNGSADLVLGTVTRSGTSPNQFQQSNDLCSGQTLAPTATCTVGIKFAPTSSGAKDATLQIPSNDPVTPLVSVPLDGTGSGGATPVIFVSPTTLPFGTLAVGSVSSKLTVTVQNTGASDLILGTITRSGANPDQFQKAAQNDLCSGVTLIPTATCTVGIKFAPTSSGAKNATLLIPSNDPVTPQVTVTLTGTGSGGAAPEITVTPTPPTPLAFGTVSVGTVSAKLNVTIKNDGTAGLVIGAITRGGTSPNQFQKAAQNDLCSNTTLAPGLTCTVGIKFAPTSTGAKDATLVIPSNDSDEATVTVPLTGTGQ